MKEKEDKLRLVKQILVDDNGINPAIASSKEQVPELISRVVSPDRDTRTSRKVTYCSFLLKILDRHVKLEKKFRRKR